MTKLTYNIVSNRHNSIIVAEGITSYPEAKKKAEEMGGCTVVPVYTNKEIDENPIKPLHRLVARV